MHTCFRTLARNALIPAPIPGLALGAALLASCASEEGARAGDPPPAKREEGPPKAKPEPEAARFVPSERPAIAPAESHPFSARDLLEMDRVGTPVVSPDEEWVYFTRRTTVLEENKGVTTLWRVPLGGGEPEQLTFHPKGAGSPAISPDGAALYFLSSRSGSSQLWRLPLAPEPGEPIQISDLPLDIAAYRLTPDGQRVVVSVDVFLTCPPAAAEALRCTKERRDEKAASGATGRIYDEIFVRHWDTWKDGRRAQLFALPLDGGAPVRVTRSLTADVPPKPWWGAEAFEVTPDGRSVVFVAKDAEAGLEPVSTDYDLYRAPLDGSAAPDKLTDNPAWDDHPLFSPDGETLAYVAMERAGYESDRMRIMLRPWPEGEARALTEEWDRSVADMAWADDGKSLLVTAYDLGNKKLFRVDASSGEVTEVVGAGHVTGPDEAKGRLIFRKNDLAHPDELFTAALDGSDVKALTHVNDERLARAERGEYEQLSFSGAGGDTIYGWVVKPAGYEEGERYPIAFLIHGGPQGSFSNRFHYRWNPQTYAGAGFGVVTIDFHGSVGYGQAFTDAIRGDWGGKPLEDLQKGLAAATTEHPWLDGDRACALGASYGGYMVNWIAGAWPDRFACLVNHDGIFDQRSMYWATEELWFPEWEHGGPYHEAVEGHERHNPLALVSQWQTPMLVIHGALDFRVPLEQGLQTFNALQRRGVKSRLLYFPDENHWVLRPKNSLQWHREVERWLKEHTETEGG